MYEDSADTTDIYSFAQQEEDDDSYNAGELAFIRGAMSANTNFDEELDVLDY